MAAPPTATADARALRDAMACKERGTELFKGSKYEAAAEMYLDGIMGLVKAQRNASNLDLIATLRSNRAACLLQLAREGHARGDATKVKRLAVEVIRDTTAVLDLGKHAGPMLAVKARMRRAEVTCLSIDTGENDGEAAAQARADLAEVCSDPLATAEQKERALKLQQTVAGAQSAGKSILDAFLSHGQLMEATGLRVGTPGEPKLGVVKSFMDKRAPVNMTDGTLKEGGENAAAFRNLDELVRMKGMCSEAEWRAQGFRLVLNQLACMYGPGAGTYLGEVLWWRMRKGTKLGKQKWETGTYMQQDVATLGELWDMRWVFPSAADAQGFHLDMLEASRAENGSGYLEGPDCREMRLPMAATQELEAPVLIGCPPRKLPKKLASSLEVAHSPQDFTQRFGLVFTVDRVVVKLMAFSGLCPRRKLEVAALMDLAHIVARDVLAWLQSGARPEQSMNAISSRLRPSALESTGLVSVDPSTEFVCSFHAHAVALRESAPWERPGAHQHVFMLGATHLGAATRVAQLLGASGRSHYGIQVWPSFEAFLENRLDKAAAHKYPAGLLIVEFMDPEGDAASLLRPDVELAKRCKASTPSVNDPLRRHFPVLMRGSGDPKTPLCPRDAQIAEAAMAMAVSFFANLVCAKPVPPPPHAICYGYEPCSATLAYCSGVEEMQCSPAFPAGIFPQCDYLWSSYPFLVQTHAARPTRVRTIGEAVTFHRAALSRLGELTRCRVRLLGLSSRPELNGHIGVALSFDEQRERYSVQLTTIDEAPLAIRPVCLERVPTDKPALLWVGAAPEMSAGERWRAHAFGLANALWEMETADAVAEACELGERILADGADCSVTIFLLDLYLERGEWGPTLDLLRRQRLVSPANTTRRSAEDDSELGQKAMQDTWAWTTALARLKKYGADSNEGVEAVQIAIQVNSHVYPFLVGDKAMPTDLDSHEMQGPFKVSYLHGVRVAPEADEASAIRYMKNFRHHWWMGGGATSRGNAILQSVRRAGEDTYRDECRQLEVMLADAYLGNSPTPKNGDLRMPRPPNPAKSICANCGAFCDLQMCARCREVGYCSKECQKVHWKAGHKQQCRKA